MEHQPVLQEGLSQDNSASHAESAPLHGVSQRYKRINHLCSLRTAECFEAREVKGGERVQLWMLRFPLLPKSQEAARFISRLKQLSALNLSTPRFRAFGVESSGTAFLATDFVEFKRLLDVQFPPELLPQTFLDVLRLIEPLHRNGIVVGDISADSFAVEDSSRLLLLGLLGTFDGAGSKTSMLPPPDTYHYLSPEQKTGDSASSCSDVYALGVFAYRLLSGQYFLGEKSFAAALSSANGKILAPSLLRPELPAWLDDIVGRCIAQDPRERYNDVCEVISAVKGEIKTLPESSEGDQTRQETIQLSESEVTVLKSGLVAEDSREITERSGNRAIDLSLQVKNKLSCYFALILEGNFLQSQVSQRFLSFWIWPGAVLFGLFVASGVIFFFENDSVLISDPAKIEFNLAAEPLRSLLHYSTPEIKKIVRTISSTKAAERDKQLALEGLAEIEDPVSYAVLLTLVRGDNFPELRASALQFLLNNTSVRGLRRTAKVIRDWSSLSQQQSSEVFVEPTLGYLLSACDRGQSVEARANYLSAAYAKDPVVALKVTAAMVIDEPDERFAALLREFLAKEFPGGNSEELENRSSFVLLLVHPELGGLFADDLLKNLSKLGEGDLRWGLKKLAAGDRQLFVALANEVAVRDILSGVQEVFLEPIISSNTTIATNLRQALVRGALSEIDRADVSLLAGLNSETIADERLLFALCAGAGEADLGEEAFLNLAGRDLKSRPGGILVSWAKARFWEQRGYLIPPICIVALHDVVNAQQLEQAFFKLQSVEAAGLFPILLQSNARDYLIKVIQFFGPRAASNELIPLLSHGDKDLRIAVIKVLAGRNELLVLQAILRAFKNEKDAEVRRVYEESHWVTKQSERGDFLANN